MIGTEEIRKNIFFPNQYHQHPTVTLYIKPFTEQCYVAVVLNAYSNKLLYEEKV